MTPAAAIRIARYLTKRPKILVVSWCYHGSVDEAIAIRDPKSGKVVARGQCGAAG